MYKYVDSNILFIRYKSYKSQIINKFIYMHKYIYTRIYMEVYITDFKLLIVYENGLKSVKKKCNLYKDQS
jgi:hypothetical protein